MTLHGKTFLVTGASRGIGHALAVSLAQAGASLLLVARSVEPLENFVGEYGRLHQIFPCDLTNPKEVATLIESIRASHSQLDGLIHAAGIGIYKPLSDISFDEWQQSIALGLHAPFLLTQGLLQLLQQSDDSVVLNIGSICGVVPRAERSSYCATKFGLRGLSLSLSKELEGKSPRVCLVTLGSTLTSFGPLTTEQKSKKQEAGKAYFPVEWVANKITEIICESPLPAEVTLLPSEWGFGGEHASV